MHVIMFGAKGQRGMGRASGGGEGDSKSIYVQSTSKSDITAVGATDRCGWCRANTVVRALCPA